MQIRRTSLLSAVLVGAMCCLASRSLGAPNAEPAGEGDRKQADDRQPTTKSAERGSAETAAKGFIDGLVKQDADALARVIAPGEDGSAEERAKLTLQGKGSLRGIAGAVKKGEKIWAGKVESGPAGEGPQIARVHLLRKGKRGDDRSAGSLEVVKGEDGWRVNDWDMPH